ncbi:MAG: hypothetical protein IJB31_06210 [Akkermansia sp.]|nr:hypothetical protein [Akkermansia sp.]
MKLHLPKLLLAALLALPLSAVEWTTETTGDQTVTENVTVTGTAPVGNITFNGGDGSTITVSGDGSIGNSGNLTVSSGTVVIDGVSRTGSNGSIQVSAGAALELVNGTQILTTNYNNASVVDIYGTLKVEKLQYQEGNLGALRDNTGSIKMYDGSRLEITGGGEATVGVSFQGWGATYTIALASGAEDALRTMSWNTSQTRAFTANSGGGCKLIAEVGEYAQLTLNKSIGTGLALDKTGKGELVLNGTVNLDSGRGISVVDGTLKLGDNANITSAGSWFTVDAPGTLDMNGKAGVQGQALTANGTVLNAQNNNMTITLGETGSLSISANATGGHGGSIIMAAGSTVDLGGFEFYNSIDFSAGGELINAANFRGSVVLGVDDEGNTAIDSDDLKVYKNGLASAGSLLVSLSEHFDSTAPDYNMLKGRLYAANSVSIKGTGGAENISITGYTSTYGAVSAQGADIAISNVGDVSLSDNQANIDTGEVYFTAGALSAAGSVTIDAAGDVVISGNSAEGNTQAAGAIYAGEKVNISGASILIEDNTYNDGNGGAVRGDADAVKLTGTEGDITLRSNTAGEAGGAVYASTGVEISSAADVIIEQNTATAGDGGAIYSGGDVTITPGDGAQVTISGNTAGGSGGAIYSSGTVKMSGGSYEISNNTADGYGGAIYAETGVDISADAGDITFSGNTHDGGTANDVELWDGEANLSASNGHTLEMQGGVTGAADMNISTDDASAVKLGGTSSTANLTIQDGRLFGITSDSGEQAVINIAASVTLSNAYMQDVALVDESIEAALTSENSTYIFNNAPASAVGTYSGEALTYITTAPLLNGFTTIDGLLSVGVTYDFLKAFMSADGTPVNVILTLTSDDTGLGDEFTFTLDENTIALLEASQLESYGFYDADNNLIGENEAALASANGVTFAMKGITKLVPEPTSTTLSLLALAALAARRRRRA